MCSINLKDYLASQEIADNEIPNELDKRGFTDYSFKKDEQIYEISSDFKTEDLSSKAILNIQQKQFYFDKDKNICQVYLSNIPSDCLLNYILNEWKEEQYPYWRKEMDNQGLTSIHRGHYIANTFKKYLIPKKFHKEQKVQKFFGRGNVLNVYPQSAKSNCSAGMKGQLDFEREVWNFLDSNIDGSVFYEVENIKFGDIISLGRRVRGIFIEKNELVIDKNFHVFIPNIYYENDCIEEPTTER